MIPILVQVFTRYSHFFRCVESLRRAVGHENFPLIVLSDEGRNEAERSAVEKVRKYVYELRGFAEVVPLFAERNTGSHALLKKGLEHVFSKYDKLIYLEDDNIVAPGFLEFISSGLYKYEKDPKCFSISGFTYRTFEQSRNGKYKKTNYQHAGFCAWGVGLWKDKWNSINTNLPLYYPRQFFEFVRVTRSYPHLYDLASAIRSGRLSATDCAVHLNIFKRGWYSIHPSHTLVNNIGFDGTGEHCNSNFNNQSPLHQGKLPPISNVSWVPKRITFSTFGSFRQAFWSLEKFITDRIRRVLE